MAIEKIQKVDLREIWRHEASDFTRWLAQNIDFLNEVIGLDISVETIEGSVGPYRVDIYGEDGTGNKVIIENQLEATDHKHLGQILTYFVNLDARIGIWITANPVEEHKQVIEWLNETTPDDMYFYLVQVEGIRIGNNESVAPLFTLVEGPTLERKKIGAEKKEHARRHLVRERFWSQFLEKISDATSICQNNSPSTDSWIGIALGIQGIGLNLVVTGTYARAEIFFNRGDTERNKKAFDILFAHKDEIEKELGTKLDWARMDGKVTARIKWQLDEVDLYDEEQWPRMNEFLVEAAIKMHKIFKEKIQEVRKDF